MRRLFHISATLLIYGSLMAADPAPKPPVAPQKPHTSLWHGEKVEDPWFWLREKANPEVVTYLEAENAYTETMTRDLQPFSEALYKEMLGRIKQTDLSVPVRRGAFYYYARTEEGKQYPIQCGGRRGRAGPTTRRLPKRCCWTRTNWPRA